MARGKRRFPRLPWTALLWVAVAVNLWVGIHHSHLTDLRVVRVSGATAADEAVVSELSQRLQGSPALQIDPYRVESQTLELADVQEAVFRRNFFGEARLEIQPNVAIVAIKGTQLGLTAGGAVVPLGLRSQKLPMISLPPGSLQPIVGVCQPLPLTLVVQAAIDLQRIWREPSVIFSVNQDGTLVASSPIGPQIEFGSIADYKKKFDVLHQILQQHPEMIKPGIVINLVDPSHPVERNGIQLKRG